MASRCFPLPQPIPIHRPRKNTRKLFHLTMKNYAVYLIKIINYIARTINLVDFLATYFTGLSGSIFYYIKNKTFLSKANSKKGHQYYI